MKNNYSQYLDEILEIYKETGSASETARKILGKYFKGRETTGSIRAIQRLISRNAHKSVKSQLLDDQNVPLGKVSGYWAKEDKDGNLTHSAYIKPNLPTIEDLKDVLDFDFSEVEKIKHKPVKKGAYDFDRSVYSDVHIGMETDFEGTSMYAEAWNEKELMKRCDIFADHILVNQKSNVLYLDDLGDLLDGYDGKTTRKGHDLPQNMNNREQFDNAFKFKQRLVASLAPNFDKVIMNNITVDNHSGSFGYILNSASKEYLELRHNNVKVHNHLKLINHYNVGKCLFLISHGKDHKSLKFGFSPDLSAKLEKKILNYLKHYNLLNKYEHIEFSKGDSHQYKFDNDSSEFFRYYNYPSFAPSSEWGNTNFQKGWSGAITFNYRNNGTKSINELKF